MARRLREARLAHGDLQHGNILLVPGRTANALAVKLIDYDGMWVPELARRPSGEVGHANYQHPQRLREAAYVPEVDRFPLLVVAAALRGLRVGGPGLWHRYDNGDNLLFREGDLAAPSQSPLFAELLRLDDPLARALATQLLAAAERPLDQVPLLEELLPERPAAVPPAPAVPPQESAFRFGDDEGGIVRRRRPRKAPVLPLVLGAVVLAAGLVGGGIFLATRSRPPAPPVAQLTSDAGKQGHPVTQGRQPGPDDGKKSGTGTQEGQENPPAAATPLRPAGPVGEVDRWAARTGGVWGVAVSPDGRRVLVAGDRGLALWDARTGRKVHDFEGHEGRVWCVAFSPDGRQALSGGLDRTLRLWDVESGRQLKLFQGHRDQLDAVAFDPASPRVFSASRNSTCRVWSTRTGQEVRTMGTGPLAPYALAVSPDGRRALFAAADNSVCVWDIDGGHELRRLRGHAAHVYALAFAPGGRAAASAGADRTVRLWDLERGDEVGRLDRHTGAVLALAFLRDGRLLSCGDDNSVRLWDPAGGDELCRLEGHTAAVRGVAVVGDGRYAVSGSLDETVRLWRLPPATALAGAPLPAVPRAETVAGKTPENPPEKTPGKVPEKVPEKAETRAPVPPGEALAEADREVRDVYRVEFTRRKPEEMQALAGKLLRRGQRGAETPALRFALLREARNVAAGVPDPALSLQAVNELAKVFAVDPLPLKADALVASVRAARTAAALKPVSDLAWPAAEEAVAADDYATALRLLAVAGNAAGRLDNKLFLDTVARRKAHVERLQKEFDRLGDTARALKSRPDDPAANLAVGRFRCLDKEDWKAGLPLLVKGGDATLAGLAGKDLVDPVTVDEQVELGNGWWALAEKESGPARAALVRRARHWYRQALPQLEGAGRAMAEDRLKVVSGRLQLKPGLVAELFADESLGGKVKSRIDYKVEFNWGNGPPDPAVPADRFSVRWQGYLVAPRKGLYTLVLHADDGARLWLDNKPVIDTWDKGGRQTAMVALDDKAHLLRLEHREGIGLAMMYFGWLPEGGLAEQAVPPESLFHDPAQEKLLAK
jgi:hypothetical protein